MAEDIGQVVNYATCHPDRECKAKGLCKNCYDKSWHLANPGQQQRWREANPDKAKEVAKKTRQKSIAKAAIAGAAWRKKYPERYARIRLRVQLKKYGISVEQYDEMLARQDSVCAGCRKPCQTFGRLCVDHCHKTNVVRGLLCSVCNLAIGGLKEDPSTLRRLADYLERNQK